MSEQQFYGHGKVLLTGEYFVLDGAKSIALPTKLGQRMKVRYRPSNNPTLYWKSFDSTGDLWLKTKFEQWHFNCLDDNGENPIVLKLQEILKQARKQNIHFFRENVDVHIETHLEFPLNWGLGSSSTLIYNIAQWAFVSPFELQAKTFSGSGYDIACAQSMGPISYQLKKHGPHWETLNFSPLYKNQLYFIYLGQKQDTREEITRYRKLDINDKQKIIQDLNQLTDKIMSTLDLKEYEELLLEHERIISNSLQMPRVQDKHFQDYWGVVKSLGAWGGDFALVTSDRSEEDTRDYFMKRGFNHFYSFEDMILQNFEKFEAQLIESQKEEMIDEQR